MINNSPAMNFILMAVQEWGQSEADRTKATQRVLDAARFNATATCGPVFGSIWMKDCEGLDGDAATLWLRALTGAMPRGKFETEVAYVQAAIDKKIASQ